MNPTSAHQCNAAARRAVILRGIPGAGKSTLARAIAQTAGVDPMQAVFNTDTLFHEFNGGVFSAAMLTRLHQINLVRFIEAAARGQSPIICDNTNTERWEYAAYEAAARALGYEVSVRLVGNPADPREVDHCIARNIGGVPPDLVRAMAHRLAATLPTENFDAL